MNMTYRVRWARLLGLAALALVLIAPATGAQPRPGWPASVTIGSAPIGGVFHLMAGGYARIIGERMGVPATNRVTGGSNPNLHLTAAREIDIGLTSMGPLFEALQGTGEFRGRRLDTVRVVLPMFANFAHWMVDAASPIRTTADISGRVVVMGPRGSAAEFVGTRALEALRVTPRRVVNMTFPAGARAMGDGLVDVNFGVLGIPVPAWVEYAITRPARFFGFTRSEIETLTEQFPYLTRAAIRPGVYRGQDHVIHTVAMWGAVVVHRDMPEDFVYELVRTIFANRDFLETVHPAAAETLPVNIFFVRAPLHPGAVRFFREQGIRLVEAHIPPEMRR
jgi:TRAP transporter TAXI family solute receptor